MKKNRQPYRSMQFPRKSLFSSRARSFFLVSEKRHKMQNPANFRNNWRRWQIDLSRILRHWHSAICWLIVFSSLSFLTILYMNVKVSGNLTKRQLKKKKEIKAELLKVNQVMREALRGQGQEARNFDLSSGVIVSPLAKHKIVHIKLPSAEKKKDNISQ